MNKHNETDNVKDVSSMYPKQSLFSTYGYVKPAEKIWADNLKNKLTLKIKGEIKYTIIDDILLVDIYSVNYMVYRYTINNLQCKILTGYDVEMVAQSIYKGYKGYIMNLYFNEKSIDK